MTSSNFSQIKALVADDHPQMRKAIVRILNKMQLAQVDEAINGSEAIALSQEITYDLFICDLYMPELGGIDVIEHIRQRDLENDIPVLVVSGEAARDDIVKASDVGASDYLLKPFLPEDLTTKVTMLLTKYLAPDPVQKKTRHIERLISEGKFSPASILLDELLKQSPQLVRPYYLKGLVTKRLGNLSEAKSFFEKALSLNSSFYKSHAALADILALEGANDAAVEAMKQELTLNPKQPLRQSQFGSLLLRLERLPEACEAFRESLKMNMRQENALLGMAKSFEKMGNSEKAIYYYKRVRRYHPDHTGSLESIVKLCLSEGEDEKAEHILKDEKKLNKSRLDTYVVLAKLYAKQEKYSDGLEVIEAALSQKSDYLPALRVKASLYLRMKESKKALETFTALGAHGFEWSTYHLWIDLLIQLQDFAKAEQLLLLAVQNKAPEKEILKFGFRLSRSRQEWVKAYFSQKLLALASKDNPQDAEKSLLILKECLIHLNDRRKSPVTKMQKTG